jgi:processive 1,2-diacylglycerol beta-glucosyltransferase
VMRLPMLIYRPIPGQEEENCEYLLEHGVALAPKSPEMLRMMLDDLLAHPARLEAMRQAAVGLARPRAAERVVDLLARLASGAGAGTIPQRTFASSTPTH